MALSGAGRPRNIFLSYGHDEHTPVAQRLKADLESHGHAVWYDVERLVPGQDWEAYIEEGLRQAEAVVLIMTPYSVRRRDATDPGSRDGFCLNELAKALELNRPIVPILLVDLPEGPPVSISRIQYLDMRDALPLATNEAVYERHLARLLRAIEHDELDFEGGQARLRRMLGPIDFSTEARAHLGQFVGRGWLFDEIDSWLKQPGGQRVFWLLGGPGVGKSAFAMNLGHYRREVVAQHFCVHGHGQKANAHRAVLSLAYQLAQHLPAYAQRLQQMPPEDIAGLDARTVFEVLFVEHLVGLPEPGFPAVVVIDALDEGTDSDGRNEIAEVIRESWSRTPQWLRLFITSRPEVEVTSVIGDLDAFVFDSKRTENLQDLVAYFKSELIRRGLVPELAAIERVVANSEGMFLYAKVVLSEMDQGRLNLAELDAFPAGLAGYYQSFFRRQFPDKGHYRAWLRPVLDAICAQHEPLPLPLLASALGVGNSDLRSRLAQLGALFPITSKGAAHESVTWFHKSVVDWLTGIEPRSRLPRSGHYALDLAAGEETLAQACWTSYVEAPRPAPPYVARAMIRHLVNAARRNDARTALLDCHWLIAKLEATGIHSLLSDFDLLGVARDEPLRLLRDAIRLSAYILDHRAEELCDQLVGRLIGFEQPELQELVAAAHRASRRPRLRPIRQCLTPPGGPLLRTFAGHRSHVDAVAFSPDGKTALSGSAGYQPLRLWDLATGAQLRSFEGAGNAVLAVAFSADGRTALSGSGDMRLWDVRTGTLLRSFEGHSKVIKAVALSPDGRTALSGSRDQTIRLWDLETGALLRTLEGHSDSVLAIAVSPDGTVALSGSRDETLRLWDLRTGEQLRTFAGHIGDISAVAISPDGLTAISGSSRFMHSWDLQSGQRLRTFEGHTHRVSQVAISPDGKTALSGSWDQTLRLWDLHTGALLRTFEGHSFWVESVAISPDGTTALSGGCDFKMLMWDLRRGTSLRPFETQKNVVTAVAVSPNGTTALSGLEDRTLRLWQLETGAQLNVLSGHTDEVSAVAISPNGAVALSGSRDTTVRVWDLATGHVLRTFAGHTLPVSAVAISPDGKTALSGAADTLKLWDLGTGALLHTFECNGARANFVHAVVISPDGKTAVSSALDGMLRLWDLGTRALLRVFGGDRALAGAVAISRDGKAVLSGTDDENTVRLWDIKTGALLRTFEDHTDDVLALALSPDGRFALSGSRDHTIRLWDLATGTQQASFTADQPVRSLAVTPDGRYVVVTDRLVLAIEL